MNIVAFGLVFAVAFLFSSVVRTIYNDKIDLTSIGLFWVAILLFALCFGAVA